MNGCTALSSIPYPVHVLGNNLHTDGLVSTIQQLGLLSSLQHTTHLHVLEATIPPAPLGQLTSIASQRRLSLAAPQTTPTQPVSAGHG